MDDKTIWRCPTCGRDGCIDHASSEPIIDVLTKIVEQHFNISPLCTEQFGKFQIRWCD